MENIQKTDKERTRPDKEQKGKLEKQQDDWGKEDAVHTRALYKLLYINIKLKPTTCLKNSLLT